MSCYEKGKRRVYPGRFTVLSVLLLVLVLGGCSFQEQGAALRQAVNAGQIKGIAPEDIAKPGLRWTYPDMHPGEFSRVSIFNVTAAYTKGTSEYWTVVMGLDRADGKWRVLYASKRLGRDKWQAFQLKKQGR